MVTRRMICVRIVTPIGVIPGRCRMPLTLRSPGVWPRECVQPADVTPVGVKVDCIFRKGTVILLIKMDWFNERGKWKYGGVVEVGDIYMFDPNFKQILVNNQTELMDGWEDHDYYVVLDNIDNDSNSHFCKCLYPPGSFAGMRRRI